MDIKFDLRELGQMARDASRLPDQLDQRYQNAFRGMAIDLRDIIRIRMPRDTGLASNSWGHDVWILNLRDFFVEMGGVYYIEELEEGKSKQAPAGFIDMEINKALARLADELDSLTPS